MPKRPAPEHWTPEQKAAEAERIVLSQTPELLRWLESEGLSLADYRGNDEWGPLMGTYTRSGTKHAAKSWHRQCRDTMVQYGVTRRADVAAKIAIWFLGAQMEKSGAQIRPLGQEPTPSTGLSPEEIWVFRHPLVQYPINHKAGCCETCKRPFTNPVVQSLVNDYERENKAPNEQAVALLRLCLDDAKFLQDIWKKGRASAKPEDDKKPTELTASQERIEQLKAQLAASCADSDE